ncbi:MAG TPA: hypothetical protein VK211_04070 [Kamptonema sp.]|nr:hypothetical protein [Kamptonema sp.]
MLQSWGGFINVICGWQIRSRTCPYPNCSQLLPEVVLLKEWDKNKNSDRFLVGMKYDRFFIGFRRHL